jgi:pyruvate dehydrogenase E1 component alpha subunit
VEMWMKRDPLLRLRRHLIQQGLLDDAADTALEQALNAEIAAAIKEAEAFGQPPRESLFDDVYAELPWHLKEQRADLLRTPKAPSHEGSGQ